MIELPPYGQQIELAGHMHDCIVLCTVERVRYVLVWSRLCIHDQRVVVEMISTSFANDPKEIRGLEDLEAYRVPYTGQSFLSTYRYLIQMIPI